MIFVKISQNFIKSHLKICLNSQTSIHSLWHVCMVANVFHVYWQCLCMKKILLLDNEKIVFFMDMGVIFFSEVPKHFSVGCFKGGR